MRVGERAQLSAVLTMSNGSRADGTASSQWTTNNPSVIAVVVGGVMTATSPGVATVTTRFEAVTAQIEVTVEGGGSGVGGSDGDGGSPITRNPWQSGRSS